jgi:acetoin utilization deacetylase AcuC-like enzyme
VSTGLVYHPACVEHDTGRAHPERPQRLRAVRERLDASGLAGELEVLEPRTATRAELLRIHDARHLDAMEARCARGPGSLDGDTHVGPASWRAALLAAGGMLEAVEKVERGEWRNAFVAVRPPGHHAEHARAMGFCLLNNVAIAAAALRARGRERVAILDRDVHHGNGTQHLFERDPSVFYASLHQWPLYPGTGAAEERGLGAGEGATLNCPMEPGTRDADWITALEAEVLPAFEAFEPDFVLISAGFDAHERDPLADVRLSEDGFRVLTRRMVELAAARCGGRLVSVLEGGYDLQALASSVEAHVEELRAGAS